MRVISCWRGSSRQNLSPLMRLLRAPRRPNDRSRVSRDAGCLCRSNITLHILIDEQPIARQTVSRRYDRRNVVGVAGVPLFQRHPWITGREALSLGPGECDLLSEMVAAVIPTHRHRTQVPPRICGEWRRDLGQADPGNIVAVSVGLRNKRGIRRADDAWRQCREKSLAEFLPVIEQVASVHATVVL